MNRASSSTIIVSTMILAMASGCATHKAYDVSATAPFSTYADKDVTLTRDALLLDNQLYPPGAPHRICYADDWDGRLSANEADTRRLLLPAGTKVHVTHTYLYYHRQSFFQAFFSTADLYTWMRFKLNAPGWPPEVDAFFSGWSTEFIDAIDPEHFKGTIRSAPWEPSGTPAERSIPWPDDKYRLKDDNRQQ